MRRLKNHRQLLLGLLVSLIGESFLLNSIIVSAAPVDVGLPGGNKISLSVFNPTTGWSNMGILSFLAVVARFSFFGLIVLWVFLIIRAGLIIVTSEGGDKLKSGMKRIRTIWLGVTMGLVFFIAVSFIGTFAGVGTIFEWSDNLLECKCDKSLIDKAFNAHAVIDKNCYQYKFQAKATKENDSLYNWECYQDDKGSTFYGLGWKGIKK